MFITINTAIECLQDHKIFVHILGITSEPLEKAFKIYTTN